MNHTYKNLIASSVLASSVLAAPEYLKVATGVPGGTSSLVFRDMGKVCAGTAYLLEKGTSGGPESLEKLLSNDVSLAFVQVDALTAKKEIDQDPRVDNVRALIPLYPQEMHIVARADLSIKSGGFFSKKITPVTKFSQLAGLRVGAWGSAAVTARVVQAQTGVKYGSLIIFDGKKAETQGLAALDAGKIDAIMTMAGKPIKWIAALPQGRYKLLAFDVLPKISATLYSKATVNYTNLSGDPVATFSTLSVLATRNFKTLDKAKMLTNYRKCIVAKMSELQEGEGFHPKWSVVDPTATPPWPSYQPVLK